VRIFLMAICQHALAWVDLFESDFGWSPGEPLQDDPPPIRLYL